MTFKVDVETVDSVRRRLAVEVPAEEVSAEIEKAYAQLARAAKVRGFRPGRVPRPVLERLFGDRVRGEVFEKLIQQSYAEVVQERQIAAVGHPEIVTEQAQPGAALRYSATVEVKPEIVVEHYAGLEADRPVASVTGDDVAAFLDRLRQSFAQLHPITDRSTVESGDVATVDYEGRVDSRVVGHAENREIEVGANGFPSEFDQHLIGAAVGNELKFAVHYPPEYGSPELAGKTVDFRLHVRALSHKEVPLLDDEFAKDHGECSTLDDLRQRVRTRLEAEAAQQADEAMRQALLSRLADANDIPIPTALVERRTEALMEDVWREWQQRRIRPKNETEALARLRAELQPRARHQVKIGLLLEAIARQESIGVTESDVEERIAALAADAGAAAERLRAVYQDAAARRDLRNRMLQARALDALVRVARVTTRERPSGVAAVGENG